VLTSEYEKTSFGADLRGKSQTGGRFFYWLDEEVDVREQTREDATWGRGHT
jgi:hypothetical protein